MECCGIGRDLIRLLSAVARIPEMEKLWSDIIHKPQVSMRLKHQILLIIVFDLDFLFFFKASNFVCLNSPILALKLHGKSHVTYLTFPVQVLSPSFTGILSLLQARTSRKFLTCRITPDMETKIHFLLHKVCRPLIFHGCK